MPRLQTQYPPAESEGATWANLPASLGVNMDTGTFLLATQRDGVPFVLVTIDTSERLRTLKADASCWPNGADSIREGEFVQFDAEGEHLVGINAFGSIGLYATQRHPRWDKGETWAQVRSARP